MKTFFKIAYYSSLVGEWFCLRGWAAAGFIRSRVNREESPVFSGQHAG